MIGNTNDKTDFPHKLLLIDRQASQLCKVFVNNLSANIKLSKTQLSKITQSGRCLCRLLGPLLKMCLPLMKNVFKPLSKGSLILFGLTTVALAPDVWIQKKSFRIGALYGINIANNNISNSNLRNGIYHKKIKSLVESGLLIKGASKIIKNKTK